VFKPNSLARKVSALPTPPVCHALIQILTEATVHPLGYPVEKGLMLSQAIEPGTLSATSLSRECTVVQRGSENDDADTMNAIAARILSVDALLIPLLTDAAEVDCLIPQ